MNKATSLESLKDQILSPNELQIVKDLLRTNPKAWREFGDLYTRNRIDSLDFVLKDTVEFESITYGIEQLRKGLLGDNYSSLEEVVVEQIVDNHLRAVKADMKLRELNHSKETETEELYWDKIHERAHNRIMRGIKNLVSIQRTRLDMELKLYKNRPENYDRNDYLDKSTEELGARQLPVEFYKQCHYELSREKFGRDWNSGHVKETCNEEVNQAIRFAVNRSGANQQPSTPATKQDQKPIAETDKQPELETVPEWEAEAERQFMEEMRAHEALEAEAKNTAAQSHHLISQDNPNPKMNRFEELKREADLRRANQYWKR